MEKERYFSLIREIKKIGGTPQELEKYWDEFENSEAEKERSLNSKLAEVREVAESKFLGKIISTERSYILVKNIETWLHYSGTGILVRFSGPRLDINILEKNTISIHTWDNIHYGVSNCGGEHTILFTNDNFEWDKVFIIEQDVFDSVIDQLQEKVRMFIDSLKDYFYEVKV